MASKAAPEKREYIELGGEPEYFLTDIRFEPAGGGNVRVFCYNQTHHRLVLQCKVVIPANILVMMGKQSMQAGAEAFNLTQWDDEFNEH